MISYVLCSNIHFISLYCHCGYFVSHHIPVQGFNDLGYSGCSTTSTPNIDKIVTEESLQLHWNYVYKLCSPTRSAFLSGRYPATLGLQNLMFEVIYPVALTRQVSVLSEEFKANGYSTHIIGYDVIAKESIYKLGHSICF